MRVYRSMRWHWASERCWWRTGRTRASPCSRCARVLSKTNKKTIKKNKQHLVLSFYFLPYTYPKRQPQQRNQGAYRALLYAAAEVLLRLHDGDIDGPQPVRAFVSYCTYADPSFVWRADLSHT